MRPLTVLDSYEHVLALPRTKTVIAFQLRRYMTNFGLGLERVKDVYLPDLSHGSWETLNVSSRIAT